MRNYLIRISSQYNDERREFQTAILAVSSFYGIDSAEFERIKPEMVFINATMLTPSNVPVDWKTILGTMPKDMKPIGIMKLWKEIRGN